jgi:hypothetical protein
VAGERRSKDDRKQNTLAPFAKIQKRCGEAAENTPTSKVSFRKEIQSKQGSKRGFIQTSRPSSAAAALLFLALSSIATVIRFQSLNSKSLYGR